MNALAATEPFAFWASNHQVALHPLPGQTCPNSLSRHSHKLATLMKLDIVCFAGSGILLRVLAIPRAHLQAQELPRAALLELAGHLDWPVSKKSNKLVKRKIGVPARPLCALAYQVPARLPTLTTQKWSHLIQKLDARVRQMLIPGRGHQKLGPHSDRLSGDGMRYLFTQIRARMQMMQVSAACVPAGRCSTL